MESPLGREMAKIFFSHHAETWLNKCPTEFKPTFYRRHIDDNFASPESSHSIRQYMSSKHHSINFTVEHKNVSSRSFLDIKICRKKSKFVISVYRKPHLVEFPPIMKVSSQSTKRGDFDTNYFIGVLVCVVISRLFRN